MLRRLFIIFLCLLGCGYYYHFFLNRAVVELEIEVERPTWFKLYWEREGRNFTEAKRAAIRVTPDNRTYRFGLTDLGAADRLRIDPIQHQGKAVIKHLRISQKGFQPTEVDLAELVPLNQIEEWSVDAEGLRLQASGKDPTFLYVPEFVAVELGWAGEVIRLLLICLAVVTVVFCCSALREDFRYVVLMLAMVLPLIVVMAAISRPNAHPDEHVHMAATSYYQDNWLPPEIEDERIADTYSAYGYSRLNNGEIYYLYAGKVSWLASAFRIPEPISLRLGNILLFGLVLLYTLRSIPARAVAVPLLISPQVWYVFSYCCSDALGLFCCFIAGCEIVRPRSFLNRLLAAVPWRRQLLSLILVGVLVGALLLLKKNYYPFVALFYLVVAWRIWSGSGSTGEPVSRRSMVVRIVAMTVLALLVVGFRAGQDYYVNGLDRQEKMAAMAEEMAHPWFKPSTELHKKPVWLYMKARGVPLRDLVIQDHWFAKSFYSSFGQYGYLTITAPETYYRLIKWAASLLLCYLIGWVLIRGDTDHRLYLVAATALSVAMIGASLYHSWTMDFQAQGRYLFPILSMYGIVLGTMQHRINTRLMLLGISQLYFLALYSFIFVALLNIPR